MITIAFKLIVGWLGLNFYVVYSQTRSIGHLIASLGILVFLSSDLFSYDSNLLNTSLFTAKILFWSGIAVIGTFGRSLEQRRLKESSLMDVIFAKVPPKLRNTTNGDRFLVIAGIIGSLALAAVFYLGGDFGTTAVLVIMAAIFFGYSLTIRRPQS